MMKGEEAFVLSGKETFVLSFVLGSRSIRTFRWSCRQMLAPSVVLQGTIAIRNGDTGA